MPGAEGEELKTRDACRGRRHVMPILARDAYT
jgi:hypothetical protein